MANWFTKLFGGGGGDTKQVAQETYFPSQDPRYKLVQKNLEDLIASRGFGYTPEMISSTTAPYATARRANFKNYEVPEISAQASARGLGRSTIPVNRIALSGQEAERDIEQRIADLTTRSEDLKANQYQNALSGMSNLATQEIDYQNKARGYAADATNANRQADIKATQSAGIFGSQAAGPILQGIAPFLSMIPGVGPALAVGATALGGVAGSLGGAAKSAMVNKSDDDLMSQLMSLFAGNKSGKTSTQFGSGGVGQLSI